MEVILAINELVALTTTISNAVASAGRISAIIQRATAEGRTTLTPDEWAVVTASDDAGRQALVAAIAKALAK